MGESSSFSVEAEKIIDTILGTRKNIGKSISPKKRIKVKKNPTEVNLYAFL